VDLGVKNRVAIVKGSSRGIGKAIAYGLAEEGAKVTICAVACAAMTLPFSWASLTILTKPLFMRILSGAPPPGIITALTSSRFTSSGERLTLKEHHVFPCKFL